MSTLLSRSFITDIIERCLTTYVESFVALLIADGAHFSNLSLGVLGSAAVAAIPAALSVLKSLFASQVGVKGTASLTPAQ